MSTLIFAIVILHLIVGFGYMMYKLNAPSKEKKEEDK